MIGNKFLSRPQWEKKLTDLGAERIQGRTVLNTAEWWRVPGQAPFTVPVEDDGSCEFWAIQRIVQDHGGRTPYNLH